MRRNQIDGGAAVQIILVKLYVQMEINLERRDKVLEVHYSAAKMVGTLFEKQ